MNVSRITAGLILGVSVLGCTGKDLSVQLTSHFSIISPASGARFENATNDKLMLSGYCADHEDSILIISPIRQLVPCSGNTWSHELDLNTVPEGQFEVKIGTVDESITSSRTVTKKFFPAYLSFARRERSLSTASNLRHTLPAAAQPALVYVSDEACQLADCPTQNVAVRLRSEGYLKPYHVTRDLFIESVDPRVAHLPNGDLRIFYLSSETPTGQKNLYFRDFYMNSKTSSAPAKIADNVSEPRVLQKSGGQIELFYISGEYCAANACAARKVAWRSSSDNFQSVRFPMPATPHQCATANLRVSLQQNNDLIHMAYRLSASGSCAATQVEYIKQSGAAWTAGTRFAVTHTGASHLAVNNSGKAFYFYRTTWGNACSNWSLMYANSDNNFATSANVPSSCPHAVSYAGDAHEPDTLLGADGHIYLITQVQGAATSPRYSLQISSSQDNFVAATQILGSDFSGDNTYAKLLKTATGYEVFIIQSGGTDSGLIRAVQSGASTTRTNLSGPLGGKIKPLLTAPGTLGFVGTSREWCDENSCDNLNYYLENPATGQKDWLTRISQPELQLANPLIAYLPSGEKKFFYSSNEHDAIANNTGIRSSADGYASKTDLLPTNGATAGSITAVDIDPTGVIHIGGWHGPDMLYAKSTDGFAARTKVNSNAPGTSRVLLRVRDDGHVGLIQASTGTGSWADRVHSSLGGNLATELFRMPDSSNRYRAKTLLWNPAGDLEIYSLSDGNADGRRDILKYSSLNAFAQTTVITFANKSLCYSSTKEKQIAAEYDASGRLYLLYAASDDGSTVCKLYMKRSDDWTKTWRLSHNDIIGYEPIDLFVRAGQMPIACARSLFSLHCFDTAAVTPSTD